MFTMPGMSTASEAEDLTGLLRGNTEQKLQKIYSYVAGLKNVSRDPRFAKQKAYAVDYQLPECIQPGGMNLIRGFSNCVDLKSSPEEKKRETRGVRDVLQEGGGTHDELNRLFVAMVRAARRRAKNPHLRSRFQKPCTKRFRGAV